MQWEAMEVIGRKAVSGDMGLWEEAETGVVVGGAVYIGGGHMTRRIEVNGCLPSARFSRHLPLTTALQ